MRFPFSCLLRLALLRPRPSSCNEPRFVRADPARCITRSDGFDPIEPLRTTVESYPEMVGIDVTVALPPLSSLSLFLSLSLSLADSLLLILFPFMQKDGEY